jgi:hypothetical protein
MNQPDSEPSWSLRQHLLSTRVLLTLVFHLFCIGLAATGESVDIGWGLLCFLLGVGFVGAWAIVLAVAKTKEHPRRRLQFLAGEPLVALLVVFCSPTIAFPLAFPFSRPALDRALKTEEIPLGRDERRPVQKRIGLIYVTAIYRDRSGDVVLDLPGGWAEYPQLVWTAKEKPAPYRSWLMELCFGSHWYHRLNDYR